MISLVHVNHSIIDQLNSASVVKDRAVSPVDGLAAAQLALVAGENGDIAALLLSRSRPEAIITFNKQGIMETFNTAAEHLFAYAADEVIGHHMAILMAEADTDAASGGNVPARQDSIDQPHRIHSSERAIGKRKDGSTFALELFVGEASPGGAPAFTGFVRDLTARDEAAARLHEQQAELIRIARISAVGSMATALAQELNQHLTAVANYVQTSEVLIATGSEGALDLIREALKEAGRETLHAGAIVSRLRRFIARSEFDHIIA